ncbi:hypothetical protein [Vibrio caribbeanicus]|uniref:hypothetical protein n=1 Tax=Vibrio caribbeanicus TaxID=701175 RepID=UPI0030D78333
MRKKNFWDYKQSLDDVFFEITNIALKLIFFANRLFGKYDFMKKNIELKDKYSGKRGFLVANGPSINNQNLKLLKDEVTFFVNRSFLHADYEYIQPTFHIFVDNKLASGEWDIEFLDIVIEKNPSVIFLLNAKWFHLEKFQKYKNDPRFNIYWVDMRLFTTPYDKYRKIDLTKITYGAAVTGVAKMSMVYMGFKDIYFLGKEGNGLCHELIGTNSHFYGVNPENSKKSITDIYKDLYSMSLSIKNWTYFSKYCKRIGVNIYNCTEGGIFDMFERRKYEDVMDDK